MNRQEAAKLLPILQAFAEGRDIEYFDNGSNIWRKSIDPAFDKDIDYRIKPSPTYRPFANAEECWQEMLKHQPFGWVKFIDESKRTVYVNITDLWRSTIYSSDEKDGLSYNDAFKQYTFADGSEFGKLEE